jgi:hypothetical protein
MSHTIETAVRKTATAGEVLLQEGDSSGSMLYILTGSVAVSSASKGFIAHIYADNIVGHHSYVYNRPRTATVHAATESNMGLIYYEFRIAAAQNGSPDSARRGSISPAAASQSPRLNSFLNTSPPAANTGNSSPPIFPPSRLKRASLAALPSINEGSLLCARVPALFTANGTATPLTFSLTQLISFSLL